MTAHNKAVAAANGDAKVSGQKVSFTQTEHATVTKAKATKQEECAAQKEELVKAIQSFGEELASANEELAMEQWFKGFLGEMKTKIAMLTQKDTTESTDKIT